MRIRQAVNLIGARIVQDQFEDAEIVSCYTSDLLSDVMANAGDATVLITIQAHKNSVAVASLNEIRGIVICNDRPIPEDMTAAAANEGIGLLVTEKSQFEVSGLLYQAVSTGTTAH